jgi:hypothetical protein
MKLADEMHYLTASGVGRWRTGECSSITMSGTRNTLARVRRDLGSGRKSSPAFSNCAIADGKTYPTIEFAY